MGAEMNKVNRPREYREIASEIEMAVASLRNVDATLQEAKAQVDRLDVQRRSLAAKLARLWCEAERATISSFDPKNTGCIINREMKDIREATEARGQQ